MKEKSRLDKGKQAEQAPAEQALQASKKRKKKKILYLIKEI